MTDTPLSPDLEPARLRLHAESCLWQPPAALEEQVLAQLPTRRPLHSLGWWHRSWVLAPAMCASVGAIGLSILLWRDVPLAGHAAMVARSTPFVALASAAEIRAAQHPVLIERVMPRDRLPEYGFAFSPERVHEPVHAQWLVSERGQALAVRFSDEVVLKE
jgi:hypothetical protein